MASQADRIYDLLKARIVVLDLPPGSILDEDELMREMLVSRSPIRDALQRLEQDGLVVIQPSRSIFVSEVSLTDLRSVCEARLGFEGWCAYLAAERITHSDLMQLEECIAPFERATKKVPVDLLIESDRKMHQTIARATGNHLLAKMVRRLHALSVRMWRLIPQPAAGAEETMRHHRVIIEALRRGDAEAAQYAVRSDIRYFWNLVRSQI